MLALQLSARQLAPSQISHGATLSRRRETVTASDDLPARDNGIWAEGKLSFLDEVGPATLQATKRMLQRYYIDLFAGPGKNVDKRETGLEFDGSALRALRMHATNDPRITFTHGIFVNLDRADHDALRERVRRIVGSGESRIPPDHIWLLNRDANDALPEIMRAIDRRAYALVFADIEGPDQWPWTSVQALREHGHQSVEVYMLFPLGMALNRLISWEDDKTERFARTLTQFYGTDEWRGIRRTTDAHSPELRRALLELYVSRLRSLWSTVIVARDVRRRGQHQLYKMLFMTNHPAGASIAGWNVRKEQARDQGDLFE